MKSKRNLEGSKRKKYELLSDDSIKYRGRTLYRIRALRDFSNVGKGDLGGYIESEDNLSHDDDCWIYDEAKAMDSSYVTGNAKLMDLAVIRDRAVISGNALACYHSEICDDSSIRDDSSITDSAIITGKAVIAGNATIYADVTKDAFIADYGSIEKDADYFVVNQPLDSTLWDSLTFYKCVNQRDWFKNKFYIASYPSKTPLEPKTFLAIVMFRYGRFSKQYKQAKMLVKYAKQRIL